jgi:recombination protein RecT
MKSMSKQLMPIGTFTIEDIETMRHTLAKDASPDQFNLFVRTAAAAGLNPFLNHIYCIVYGGKMSIQISVEGIMFLAKRVEGYAGMDTQLVHENDVFKAKKVKDDQGRDVWEIVEHEIVFPRGKVIGCYSIAYRDGFRPVTEFMEVDEVNHHLTGNNAANWKKYFNDFFKKTVAKRAAKRQYGIEVSEDEPLEQGAGGNIPAYTTPERKDITDEVEAQQRAAEQTTQQPDKQEQPKPQPANDMVTKIKAGFKALGITNAEDRAKFYADNNISFKDPENPTTAEYKVLLKALELKAAESEQLELE